MAGSEGLRGAVPGRTPGGTRQQVAFAHELFPAGAEKAMPAGRRLYFDVVLALSITWPPMAASWGIAVGDTRVELALLKSVIADSDRRLTLLSRRRSATFGGRNGVDSLLRQRGVRFSAVFSDLSACLTAAADLAAAPGEDWAERIGEDVRMAIARAARLWRTQWDEIVSAYVGQRPVDGRLVHVEDAVAAAAADMVVEASSPVADRLAAVADTAKKLCAATASAGDNVSQLLTCPNPAAAQDDPDSVGLPAQDPSVAQAAPAEAESGAETAKGGAPAAAEADAP